MRRKVSVFIKILVGLILFALGLHSYKRPSARVATNPGPALPAVSDPIQKLPKVSQNAHADEMAMRYCHDPYAYTCAQTWPSADPTGVVEQDLNGEVRALRLMRNILQDHPSLTADQVEDALTKKIYTPKRRKMLQENFKWVRSQEIQIIEKVPKAILSASEKNEIIHRLETVRLELPPPARVYSDASDLFTRNAVYYERTPKGKLRIRVGGAYLLTVMSTYNLIFTLGHELAHSMDPCELRSQGLKFAAYDNLVQCFVDKNWATASQAECTKNDKISEVFADWIASQVVARAIQNLGGEYSEQQRLQAAVNAVKDLCQQTMVGEVLNFTSHQKPEVRISQLFGANPALHQVLRCPASKDSDYCQWRQASGTVVTREEPHDQQQVPHN